MGVETTPTNLLHGQRVEFCKEKGRPIIVGKLFPRVALWRIVCEVRVMQKAVSCMHATISVLGFCAD